MPTKYLQYIPENIKYEDNQRVHVLFMKTKSWKLATIVSKHSEDKYIVAFDDLDKTFETFIGNIIFFLNCFLYEEKCW